MNDMDNIMNIDQKRIYHQVPLRILSFISGYTNGAFSAKEIKEKTGSSKGAVSQVLRMLFGLGVLFREKKGNLFLYKINSSNIVLKYFKIFENILFIRRVIGNIQPYCYQIVLYGSCAAGSNSAESDIDLFIKTEHKNMVQKIINKYKDNDLRIQAVIQDPLEILASKKIDKVFLEQVKKGITLWEGRPIYEAI